MTMPSKFGSCFLCGNDSFEMVAAAGIDGKVKLACKKCGHRFTRPRAGIKIIDGAIKLVPAYSRINDHWRFLPRRPRPSKPF